MFRGSFGKPFVECLVLLFPGLTDFNGFSKIYNGFEWILMDFNDDEDDDDVDNDDNVDNVDNLENVDDVSNI